MAYETSGNVSSERETPATFLVVEKLRPNLAALMGKVGFRALLSRALALANPDVPWLRAVHVKVDGSFEGPDETGTQIDPDAIFEGRVVLLAQLLGLLATFIGEDLMLRLVREIWPKLSVNNSDFGKGNKK